MPRTGTVNGFYFDPEVFGDYLQEQDPVKSLLLTSGVLFDMPQIGEMIGSKNNVFTMPNYKPLTGEAKNRDGTDIVADTLTAGKQTGMAFMREKAWSDIDFTRELTGADPLGDCATKVGKFWQKNNQKTLMGIIEAVTTLDSMADHNYDISSTTTTVTDENKFGITTVSLAGQKALGDNAVDAFGALICHSSVYVGLVNQNLVQFVKGVDANGLITSIDIPMWNGIPVLVDDTCPKIDGASTKADAYVSYLLGKGSIATASGMVEVPVEFDRDSLKNGGTNILINRMKRCFHPVGFSFDTSKPVKESPTNEELATKTNWTKVYDGKIIPLVRIVTNI